MKLLRAAQPIINNKHIWLRRAKGSAGQSTCLPEGREGYLNGSAAN